MDPLCPVCNARHHEKQAHRFEGKVTARVEDREVSMVLRSAGAPVKARFDRVGYQREYMRRWRALKRG